MNIWNRLTHIVVDIGKQTLTSAFKPSSSTTKKRQPRRVQRRQQTLPGPNQPACEYNLRQLGLPEFSYRPVRDATPDPGEVVWTWVPYEENDGRGKDRPVLVVAMYGPDHVVFAQTTSQDHDHDAQDEARWGRYWMDIGSGNWDAQHRPSEVRLNRLMITHINQIRRTGGQLDQAIFARVIAAIKHYLR